MPRRVCLAIGVSSVTPRGGGAMGFGYLDGAVVAAEQIGQWALHCGFGKDNVQIVTDRSLSDGTRQPVTSERVQAAVEALFPAGAAEADHFVLSFCGHGLTDAQVGSTFWLFSDADEKRYKVSVEGFLAELLTFGIRRVSLISDACRAPPLGLDVLRFESRRAILGRSTVVTSPMFDRLAACQDGQKAYMVGEQNSAIPGKCILSGVVLDVLWGQEPAAFRGDEIDTSSFGAFTRRRATERATDYKLQLNPQCTVDPEPATLVVRDVVLAPPAPDLQPWPPPTQATIMGSVLTRFRGAIAATVGSTSFKRLHVDEAARRNAGMVVESQLAAFTPPEPGDAATLIVTGGRVRRLWSNRPVDVLRVGRDQCRFGFKWAPADEGALVLVEFNDGSCAPVHVYPGLYVVVARNRNGLGAVAYGGRETEIFEQSVASITELAAGTLTAADVDETAVRLRFRKHANPILGAIAAYLYRAVSDFDSIRRMAYFYVAEQQAVPFDIALLGEMTVERRANGKLVVNVPAVNQRPLPERRNPLPDFVVRATPSVSGTLAGRCPWLTIGWDYPPGERLGAAGDVFEFARDVSRLSNFTLLPGAVGQKLAKLWELRPYDIAR